MVSKSQGNSVVVDIFLTVDHRKVFLHCAKMSKFAHVELIFVA